MSAPRFLRPAARLGATSAASTSKTPSAMRYLHTTPVIASGVPDALGEGSAKGRTGGGKPLDSSSANAAPKPKISNLSVPGEDASTELSEEQKRDVEKHNREFDEKHDHASDAPGDKVDKKYWSGETQGRP